MTGGNGGAAVKPNERTETELQAERDALAQLLKRAEQGDRSVLPKLREALDANAEIWQRYGDLAGQAQAALVTLAAGPNVLLAESLLRKLKALKDELCDGSPSPLERLLVERVVMTWLQTAYFDGLAAQSAGAAEARLKLIPQQQDAAARRHLAALKTLAVVRKLLKPTPSTLELLRYPVGEGATAGKQRHAGGGVARAMAAVPRG
jgi:hypothetical protein